MLALKTQISAYQFFCSFFSLILLFSLKISAYLISDQWPHFDSFDEKSKVVSLMLCGET